MSETVYAQGTLVNSQTVVNQTANIFIDSTLQGAYLSPSTANAVVIQQWFKRVTSNYAQYPGTMFWGNTMSYSISALTLNDIFIGACMIPDGRVVMAPWNSPRVGIFNPVNDTYVTVTVSGTGSTTNQYNGCVLSPDGRVIFIPSSATAIGILNPVTLTWSTFSGVGGAGAYGGGCVNANGSIIFFPDQSSYYGIYNPNLNTFTTITPTGSSLPGGSGLIGGCLYPDGRIIHGPGYNYGSAGIYDPITNVFTTVPVRPSNGNGEYTGAVLIPDGRVAFIPRSANPANLGLFDPRTLAFTTIVGPTGGTQNFVGGCVLPDGRVFCNPANSTFGLIFNPVNNSYTTISGLPGGNAYNSSTVIMDGRVICSPCNGTNVGVFYGMNRPVPREFCLHPIFNKSF